MQRGKAQSQRFTLRGDVYQPVSTIRGAFFLLDIPLIEELFEDPAEGLLGDFQDVQQFCNLHPGITVDEVQDPMMRPSEAELGQNLIRVADEVPVGEKQ